MDKAINHAACALSLLGSGLLLAACSGQSGGEGMNPGDFTTESPGEPRCVVRSTRELALDQESPIGFSGEDMLALAAGRHTVTLAYVDDMASRLMLDLTSDADRATFLDRVNEGDGASTDCASQLQVSARVGFATEDGLFAEEFAVTLVATQSVETGFFIQLDVTNLRGSFDYARFDDAEYDQRLLVIDALFDRDGSNGRLRGLGRRENPDGETVKTISIGQWPASGD